MIVLGIGVWGLSSDVSVFPLFIMGVASVFGFGYPLVFSLLPDTPRTSTWYRLLSR